MNDHPDSCGCCEGVENVTPGAIQNAPGQSSIAYRTGTHAAFKTSMLACMAADARLAGLKTRADDDPAIGMMDAWATALDVLTFYDERNANEGYLRTATERRSLLELARQIGYELSPGVAASTDLAFTLESVEGAPAVVKIPVGLRAQSIPGQDELPQTFETIETAEARPAWNELRARQTVPFYPAFGDTHVYLKGVATNLRVGDALLFIGDERAGDVGSERWDFRRIETIHIDDAHQRTKVTWTPGLGKTKNDGSKVYPTATNPKVYALRTRAALFGHNAPDPADIIEPSLMTGNLRRPMTQRAVQIGGGVTEVVTQVQTNVSAFLSALADPSDTFGSTTNVLNLDTTYSQVTANSWIVLASPTYQEVYWVTYVTEESVAKFHISGKTTRLSIQGENINRFSPRSASVYCVSEFLPVAEAPIETDVAGPSILLSGTVEGLAEGRRLMVKGKPVGAALETSEVVELLRAVPESGLTRLDFTTDLSRAYQRESVTINANVLAATHGETKREVLGSGNAAQAGQAFVLKGLPLTYVSAATASGAKSTVEIRVDGVRWQEAPTLFARGATERIHTVRLSDDGKTTIRFGDGANGARLPTGAENIEATYRVGTGKAGMVKAGQVSLLMDRVLGLKSVVNPEPPVGAEDPETRDKARVNAPRTVITLDRIVSLKDFEAFARTFAGIAKAAATWLWDGEKRIVHLTIAGEDGQFLDEDSEPYVNLQEAMDKARDLNQQVRTNNYTPRSASIKLSLHVSRDYVLEAVYESARSALASHFAFDARDLGQGITSSEVITLAQSIPGVAWVDLDVLDRKPGNKLLPRLPAQLAQWSGNDILGAELLTVAIGDIAIVTQFV